MKIVMLGHSSVGKTTYMASMFGALQAPINGMTLDADDRQIGKDLQGMSDAIAVGDYPPPTAVRTRYNFHLCYNNRRVFPFVWVDYRGGAIEERSTSTDKAGLTSELRSAQGVLIFIDSTSLNDHHNRTGVNRMINLLSPTLLSIEQPMPIGVVFTKADLVDEFVDGAFSSINGFCQAIAASKNLVGTIIPVACGPQAFRVAVPLLYVLKTGVINLNNDLVDKANAAYERAVQYMSGAWWGNDIWSAFSGDRSEREKSISAYNDARRHAESIEPLIGPCEALTEYLSDLKLF